MGRSCTRDGERKSSPVNHMDLNVSDLGRSEAFYRALADRFGWEELEHGDGWLSIGSKDFYITLVQTEDRFRGAGFHRKAVGVNHIAILATMRQDVDTLHEWLLERGVPVLYGGPLDMSDGRDPNYAVFFEDPDRLKLEFVYRG
jgi:catechol 2,3-dioxygenase-like lactoylglutathione lyase family enzyme